MIWQETAICIIRGRVGLMSFTRTCRLSKANGNTTRHFKGTDKEKLDWFEIVNMVSEQLSAQERRNAIYTGEWLTESKKYFSKNGCPAYATASGYMKGSPIRQEYLETAIRWIAARDGDEIEDYGGTSARHELQ
ncbi:MAG: hypothetical protein LBT26_02855 [Clostridiales Family XIII bacterium]|jgi:hypothetical protein|nr:hypothetical protein [Clostridiales Family XIII bacterium]